MRKLIEKSIIILFSLYVSYKMNVNADIVFYFLLSMIFSLSLDLLTSKKTRYFVCFLFLVLIMYDNLFLFYFPLILYNIYFDFKFYSIFFLYILLINFYPIVFLLSILSLYLSHSIDKMDNILKENRNVRDNLKEDTLYLKKYNEQLRVDREKNIHIAILTERNRIAREIHDSIGHTISSSILQVNALKVVADKSLQKSLILLQNTLNNGMNEIRNSLHDLRNESFDLKAKIEFLIDEVPNLDIQFTYNMGDNLNYELKFDILSIIKEAITNTLKHSNATNMNINLFDQPKFYSIIIEDNGDKLPLFENKGIGLESMSETADKYGGFLNYKFKNGFKIHLTLMKGK